jgi:Fe-S cluster biogenesis protein NfuA
MKTQTILLLASLVSTSAFVVVPSTSRTCTRLFDTIVSPFDNNDGGDQPVATAEEPTESVDVEGPLELTWDNVELVLDKMRPFLIQDGGNVIISEIDGPVVKLELQVRNMLCYVENYGKSRREKMETYTFFTYYPL